MKAYSHFETDRVILKAVDVNDAEFILELLNTPKFIQYVGDRKVRSKNDAKTYIVERMLPQFERLGYANYVVIRKTDRVKMGTCGLFDRDGLEAIDIGFAFLPNYEAQGYGYEAASKLLHVAFNQFNIDIVSAIVNPDNMASQALVKKLGLKYLKKVCLPNDALALNYYELAK